MSLHRITLRWNVIALFAVVLTGCASPVSTSPPAGQLPPGTAQVSIDGADPLIEHRVQCRDEQFWITAEIGDNSGVAAVVRNASVLTVESVQIRDVDGFTGSFWTGLGPRASATMNGPTLTVRGTADGFRRDEPSRRVTANFDVVVTC